MSAKLVNVIVVHLQKVTQKALVDNSLGGHNREVATIHKGVMHDDKEEKVLKGTGTTV
jgi:hypothetical protein